MASLFQSVTPRTAGFNTVDLNAMTEVSQTIMIILMLIGGSPGSTAGGMKTTTFAVVISSMLSVFKRKSDAEAFRRRINLASVRNASAVMAMYLVLFLLGGMAIAQIEGLPMLDCFYETASAIGTVGLTLGITPDLTAMVQDHSDPADVLWQSRRTYADLCGGKQQFQKICKIPAGKCKCGLKYKQKRKFCYEIYFTDRRRSIRRSPCKKTE